MKRMTYMKKVSKTAKMVLAVILAIIVCIAVYKTCAIVKFEASAKAEYIFLQHDTTETEIHYNGRVYKSQSYIPNNYDVYKNYQDVRANRVYIKKDYAGFFYYFVTPLLFFNDGFEYFVYACPEEDPTGSFIIYDPQLTSAKRLQAAGCYFNIRKRLSRIFKKSVLVLNYLVFVAVSVIRAHFFVGGKKAHIFVLVKVNVAIIFFKIFVVAIVCTHLANAHKNAPLFVIFTVCVNLKRTVYLFKQHHAH